MLASANRMNFQFILLFHHDCHVTFTYHVLLSDDDLDNMINFTRSTGAKLLYDLNLQLRYGSDWNPTNAMEMMRYIEKKGYGDSIDFELGNGAFPDVCPDL